MKGMKTLFSVIILLLNNLEYGEGQISLSIKDFITDTNHAITDRSQEFRKAWKRLCKDEGNRESATLVIQENETYILQPLMFKGPCVSSNIHIQIDGKIEAPTKSKHWKKKGRQNWISFKDVSGLVLNGTGLLHPHGEAWWPSVPHSHRPTSIRFTACNNITYNGLTQMNSPKNHISIDGCTNVTLSNLTIIAPKDSPNTDGIDICRSHNINILDSSIQTGDDCVAINGGSSDINITRVACGPGHGISIGSLGRDGTNDKVENVTVSNCIFNRTQNGARIKSWQGGEGLAKNILFENITLIDAKHPIIIDQHYSCLSAKLEGDGVEINNVTFRYFKGTSASKIAIKLDCEETQECNNIVMEYIHIKSSKPNKILIAYCKFAQVLSSFVNIDINCGSF